MLLHDERFSGWSLEDKLNRFHFSKQYLRICKEFGWEPYLYTFHEAIKEKQVYEIDGLGIIKVFPVTSRVPPFLRFGNDHNPAEILRELSRDEPDLIHFHNYYLYSFPYLARWIKKRMDRPLTTQSHTYHQSWRRRLPYIASIFQLRLANRVFYSYEPETTVYRKLGILDKAVRVPIPAVDPSIFNTEKKSGEGRLLYVGRVPRPLNAYAEKSPALLLPILQRLLRRRDVLLTIIGDGVGLPYCKNIVTKLGIRDNVRFRGFIPHRELPRYYQEAALTLVPLKLEGIDGFFDGSIQESLACGTPVAAFKSSKHMPLESRFGFLLPSNPEKAAEDLSSILSDQQTLVDLGAKGSAFIRSSCTEEVLKTTLRDEWEGLLKR
jgi:glycosyltransferase involved in cell wall biosynthesis